MSWRTQTGAWGMCSIHLSWISMLSCLQPFWFQIVSAHVPAEVKQSRHSKTAICVGTRTWGRNILMKSCIAGFSNGLMGPTNLILGSGCSPIRVTSLCLIMSSGIAPPPPPNAPPMTVEERMAASRRHLRDPLLCHCGVPTTPMLPHRGDPPKFSPFFRSSQKTQVSYGA